MNIGKEQGRQIVRIQRPIPIELPQRPVPEKEPAVPEPVAVPVRQPAKQSVGK